VLRLDVLVASAAFVARSGSGMSVPLARAYRGRRRSLASGAKADVLPVTTMAASLPPPARHECRPMTPERAHAYQRVIQTFKEMGPSKLLGDEQERIR